MSGRDAQSPSQRYGCVAMRTLFAVLLVICVGSCGPVKGPELAESVYVLGDLEVRGIDEAVGGEIEPWSGSIVSVDNASLGFEGRSLSVSNSKGTTSGVLSWDGKETFEFSNDGPSLKPMGIRGSPDELDRRSFVLCGLDVQVVSGFSFPTWVWLLNLDESSAARRVTGMVLVNGDAAESGLGIVADTLAGLYLKDVAVFGCGRDEILRTLVAEVPQTLVADPGELFDPESFGELVERDERVTFVGLDDLFRVEVEEGYEDDPWRPFESYEVEVLEFSGERFEFDGELLADRMSWITDAGRELSEQLPDGAEVVVFTTPYSIFDGRVGDRFLFTLDTEGMMPVAMREALIAVISQEFAAAGATVVRVADIG